MINDIVEEMWRHHGRVNKSLANNWAYEYGCVLGELMGMDLSKFPQYLINAARSKMWEMCDVVKKNYHNNPTVFTNVDKVLIDVPAEEVARYEFNCGKYKWER